MINDQKMDQRITVRLTDDELHAAERAAIAEGDRKISTLIRRALLVFLRDRGYTVSNFSTKPAPEQFSPGYLKADPQNVQPAGGGQPMGGMPTQYGSSAPQYAQPSTLS